MSNRAERIAELVHADLARILRQEIKDPRVGAVSITNVRVSGDLSIAWVSVAPLGGQRDGVKMLQGIQRANGFIRARLAKALQLRYTPALEFQLDEGLDEALAMTTLLDRMSRERQAREAQAAEGEE